MARSSAPYFQFKQFRVYHERSGLKVGTDACLLGASFPLEVLASSFRGQHPHPVRILDVGTGTGVIALMLAQRLPHAHIVGLEPEPDACAEARQNMAASPFAARLSVRMESLQEHAVEKPYDVLISNPPYFAQHLLGRSAKKNQALHTLTLSLGDLAGGISTLLAPHGVAYVILPPAEMLLFRGDMEREGFVLRQSLRVYDRPGKPVLRELGLFAPGRKGAETRSRSTSFSTEATALQSATLYLKAEDGQYSTAYRSLLQDFLTIF
ncbi:MAG: tRNA1(Val) (adenine(37)-N6)-methyltransferase [Nitritalea sp.]